LSKSEILKYLGIDYSRHSAQPLRAFVQMSGYQDGEFFSRLIKELDASGIDLSDNNFNSEDSIDLHAFFPGLVCGLCGECIPLKPVTKRSVYAKCLKLFDSWNEALNVSGVRLEKHQRKIAARHPQEYMEELFRIFATDQKWCVATIRKNPSAWGLRHARNQQSLTLYNKSVAADLVRDGKWVFAAWVQFKAAEEGVEPVAFYKEHQPRLWAEYQEKHMLQEEWSEGRVEKELRQVFAHGRRITRYELASSLHESDRKLLAASRAVHHRNAGIDHNDQLVKAGFLPKILASIYAEEDDKWTRVRCFKEAQKLMQIYLDTGQPTLSREWCRLNAAEFHDALLRKVNGKSWESGLRWIGLDPKKFAVHASPRTKRGLVFQDFFKEQLLAHGFEEVDKDSHLTDTRKFLSAKSLADCSHAIQCRPDFVFGNFIIDTKTGINAVSADNDQLKRYCDHRRVVYLLTLNNRHCERRVGNGIVVTFSFKEFVDCSLDILGVSLSRDLPGRLTSLLESVMGTRQV
jgi:hypothetical protein